jgi:hypothetical protein
MIDKLRVPGFAEREILRRRSLRRRRTARIVLLIGIPLTLLTWIAIIQIEWADRAAIALFDL